VSSERRHNRKHKRRGKARTSFQAGNAKLNGVLRFPVVRKRFLRREWRSKNEERKSSRAEEGEGKKKKHATSLRSELFLEEQVVLRNDFIEKGRVDQEARQREK